jgi:hypothetical protein
METARVYYTQLLKMAKGDERPELITARGKMTEKRTAATP